MEEKSRDDTLLTPGEVAARFRVDPTTVTRWANAGKLTAVRTLGGHRRYRRSEVDEPLEANSLGTVGAPDEGREGRRASARATGREGDGGGDGRRAGTAEADRLRVARLHVREGGLRLGAGAVDGVLGCGGDVLLRLRELHARVEHGAELVDRGGELLAGPGEVGLDLLGCALAAHDLIPFFTASTSALRLALVSSADGASPDSSFFLPMSAAIPAMRSEERR